MRAWVVAVPVAFVVVAGLLFGLHVISGWSTPQQAPDFSIDTVRHGEFTLSEHRGQTVVVDLMAVDCPTCRVTERSLLELNRTHPDVLIVSVDVWTNFEDEEYLDAHMRALGADWPYGMDTNEVLFKFQAYTISKVVVVDPEGRIAGASSGETTYDELVGIVDEAQEGRGPAPAGLGAFLPVSSSSVFVFALVAGFASFFAPCAFPLLPGYVAYTIALGQKRRGTDAADDGQTLRGPPRLRDALVPGLAAAGGILLVYALMGLAVAALGETVRPWFPLLQPGVGALAIVLGVALLLGATMQGLIAPLQRATDRIVSLVTRRSRPGTLTGYFSYGLGYGAAAAGCTAPVFLALVLTAFLLGWGTGIQVFFVYAGTAALLMVVATLVAVKARGFLQGRSTQIVKVANRASGIVLIVAGFYLIAYYQRAYGLSILG